MAQARGGNALLRFRGRQKRLLGVLRGRGNAVAREFELVLDGENVGGPHASMDQGLAVEKREGLQGGSENVARFRGRERARRKKLREIVFGIFHYNIKQIKIAEVSSSELEETQQRGMT